MHCGASTIDRKVIMRGNASRKLAKTEFFRATSAFAASSYLRGHFDMSEADLSRHAENAREMIGLAFDDDDFIHDLLVSTSIMVRDGTQTRFFHRVLHEYFCALYICSLEGDDLKRAIEAIADRFDTDHVAVFLLAMDPTKLEPHWVMPALRGFMPALRKCEGSLEKYLALTLGKHKKAMEAVRALYKFHADDRVEMADRFLAAGAFVPSSDGYISSSFAKTDSEFISRDRDRFIKLDES